MKSTTTAPSNRKSWSNTKQAFPLVEAETDERTFRILDCFTNGVVYAEDEQGDGVFWLNVRTKQSGKLLDLQDSDPWEIVEGMLRLKGYLTVPESEFAAYMSTHVAPRAQRVRQLLHTNGYLQTIQQLLTTLSAPASGAADAEPQSQISL
jgi:hypothetical protein